MSKNKHRSYRVPKRISQRATDALATRGEEGVGLKDVDAVRIARALSSDMPVAHEVPEAIATFFKPGWRFDPAKKNQIALHGGEAGREWALRCREAAMVAAADAPPEEDLDAEFTLDELLNFTDEDMAQIIAFFESLPVELQEAVIEGEPLPEVVLADESEGETDEDDEQGSTEAEEVVDTALGLATALDEAVDKLSDVLVQIADEEEEDEGYEETSPEDEAEESALVYAALQEEFSAATQREEPDATTTEVTDLAVAEPETEAADNSMVANGNPNADLNANPNGATVIDVDEELSSLAQSARDRMATLSLARQHNAVKSKMAAATALSSLNRERSLAMAKMAASRMKLPTTLQAEGGAPAATSGPPGAGGPPPGGGGSPKSAGADHHAAGQPRDKSGRFAKVGALVRDEAGNLARITDLHDGEIGVVTPTGMTARAKSNDFKMVPDGTKAALPGKPTKVEDPKKLLTDFYGRARQGLGGAPSE